MHDKVAKLGRNTEDLRKILENTQKFLQKLRPSFLAGCRTGIIHHQRLNSIQRQRVKLSLWGFLQCGHNRPKEESTGPSNCSEFPERWRICVRKLVSTSPRMGDHPCGLVV